MTASPPVAVARPERPYPGLRPFDKEEWAIFFGREQMVDDVIGRLSQNRLVLIHGVSGSGKSSLVRAGVLPKLALQYRRHDAPWLTFAMRPSGGPLWNLAAEFARLEGRAGDAERIGAIAGLFNARSATLASVAASLEPVRGKSLCVLVDQLEELFNYEKKVSRDEAELFVHLIERAATEDAGDAAAAVVDLHVIITMRSEFLGECARFGGFAETINRTQYLVPRMGDDALMRAALRPAQMYGAEFDESLAERLIASVRGREDELPLLQHGLMLMWEDAAERARGGERMTLDGAIVDEAGGLAELLSDHANKVMATVAHDERRKLIVEAVFRALTDVNAEGSAIRRPLAFNELCAVTGATPEELRPILDAFRAPGVSFLTPYAPAPIAEKTPADISHEALIRCWRRISAKEDGWLQKEFREGLSWRTLLFQADNFASDKSNYLSEPATELGDKRLNERNEAWAERYGDGWPKVKALVDASREHWEDEARKERERIRIGRHNESVALTALANIEAARRPVNAAKLALAAWPRDSDDTMTPKLPETLDVLRQIVPNLRERLLIRDAYFATFGPDGARIVTASLDKTARVWDAASGKAIAVLSGHAGSVNSAAFSPDGSRIVTASGDWTTRVWDATTGKAIAVFGDHGGPVTSASFSPDGSRIVTASGDWTARVWDAATGTTIAVLSGHETSVKSAAFSPDGSRIVTASWDTTARVWYAANGKAITVLSGHEGPVFSAAFSPDGSRIVTASDDNTARVWDAAGEAIAVLSGHEGPVTSAAFSPDGSRIVTASWDNAARLWDAAAGKAIAVLSGHQDSVNSAAFSPDGSRIVTASWDHTARVWDATSGKAIAVLIGHQDRVNSAAFSPDGSRILTVSYDNSARIWDAATVRAIAVLSGHRGWVWSAAFSPDRRRIVTASYDKTARVWDAATGKLIAVLSGHENSVNSAAFSPDGSRIVTASWDKTARVWNAATGKAIAVLSGHEYWVNSAAFSSDGARVVTGSYDHTARVWDAATGKAIVVLGDRGNPVNSAAFSPDGSRIVTASSDNTARVWDAATGKAIAGLSGHKDTVWSAAFSPHGGRIVTASEDNTARVWDAATGKAIAVVSGHENSVNSAVFSPDGSRIVTASSDTTARVWDAASGTAIAVLSGHENWVNSAAFSPDGTRVVTGSFDQTARIWDVSEIPKGNILQVACALLRLREDPVSLDRVTDYPLTLDRPICVTDPPPPDLAAEAEDPAR